ncbi:DUF2884 domain-containing protein [Chimaeribacter arupi]|uniref:DUF2884 domain-containing protein n=2 Tax=Yersiniaceae TaxID=1903411 RepID=A0A2N5EJS4_9GAMM|nr:MULTISPECIES: DUF2884 domain-containing protein [Yersiniaceae]MBS0971477.1 DUF2884 domain-containing protein [Nissabacter archeti]MDV5141697.1 DUF2884 domain-containing protein [Chimaeribacter arupi]PLR45071.1 DUF2884 domain-containing protein [Chimaeribacter arupi]PLR45952.1 DUF2884 domain-containing protein [Chimaeribacter arupi]PLR50985.1 DUF2884 domain-containing protein [Chimaeribacter arupi]
MKLKTALKNGLCAAALLTAVQAQAAYQCNVKPQDDIVITPQTVQVVGASGNFTISPTGDINNNGKLMDLDTLQRQKAVDYQGALRRDLPWIDTGAQQHLEKARVALDKVIVEQLGSDSNVRTRLSTLNDQLKQQMNRILEHRNGGLVFHHQAISQVEEDGKRIVQQSMGGVLQDSLNEMGVKQAAGASDSNPLQAVMGNLGGLQQAIQAEWSNQEQDFSQFGHEVCNRVTALENQRAGLLSSLK